MRFEHPTPKLANRMGSDARSARLALPGFAMTIVLLSVSSAVADTDGTRVFKTDISRAAVTTMPAYTVEEAQSAKTHTLFMGADIELKLDRDLYPVRDVFGSNWVIEINGRKREIASRQAPMNVKVTPVLKLTETSATIVGFRRVRAYSYANDPSVLLTKGLSQSASLSSDLLAVSQNAQAKVDTMVSKNMGGMSVLAGSDDQFSANALMATAEYDGAATHPGIGILPSGAVPTTAVDSTGTFQGIAGSTNAMGINVAIAETAANAASVQTKNGNEPAGKIATGGLDAMDVEFEIRSAKPLQDPYVVTMTRFKMPGAKPGMVQNLIFAQSLHPIDEHLSNVHFVEDGFPFNYELVDFQLHVYNRGEEIATNIAADRVELTRDEAFEYVKMEYIGSHLKDTLPAAAVMAKLPSDLSAQLASGKYAATFYVKVSRDGFGDEAFTDAACTQRINDDYLDSVVKRVRFKPALNNGKPIDGIASLNLGHLKS
jgi:hypothetical protein